MHDTSAPHYDFIYDECFGATFRSLTADTLALVTEVRPPPARVLDLGAGTGRLALPLARDGYEVTAVECSPGMADVLQERAAERGSAIDLRRGDFCALEALLEVPRAAIDVRPRFDVAIAIFTVLNYVVLLDDLTALARGLAAVVRPGGHFIFDIAERRLFESVLFESERLHREVEVEECAQGTFRYRDAGSGTRDGRRFTYDDTFTLRCWREDEVLPLFARAGLSLTAEVTARLRASGSRWFILRRD